MMMGVGVLLNEVLISRSVLEGGHSKFGNEVHAPSNTGHYSDDGTCADHVSIGKADELLIR